MWSAEERETSLKFELCLDGCDGAVAEKQLQKIDRVCFVLGAWPEYGRARDDVHEGLRSISVSRHVVFYRATKTAIEIARVLDERRDVDAIFSKD